MSEENVEIVGRLYAAFEQGNFWVPEFFDPNVRVVWLDGVGIETAAVCCSFFPARDTARAMSQENVEIVRQCLEAFDPGLDGVAAFWDPDIDWRAIEGAPDDIGGFTGHDAMRRYYGQWYDAFEEIWVQAEELKDAGDQVIASVHVAARMKDSDAEIEMRLGIVYTVRNGLVVRGREYSTWEQALEAAGLSE